MIKEEFFSVPDEDSVLTSDETNQIIDFICTRQWYVTGHVIQCLRILLWHWCSQCSQYVTKTSDIMNTTHGSLTI